MLITPYLTQVDHAGIEPASYFVFHYNSTRLCTFRKSTKNLHLTLTLLKPIWILLQVPQTRPLTQQLQNYLQSLFS